MSRGLKAFEGWTTIAVFAAPCLLVALDQLVGLDPTPQVEENRYLAKAPNILEAESLTAFREDFERFYRDHMGFRDFLIRFNSLFRIHVLRSTKVESGDASVYIGADDWLYFGWALRDYTGAKRLDPGQLAWWKTALEQRTALVEAHDARYVFFAAPVKVSIYPEFLPRSVRRADGALALDQLIDHMGPHTTVQVLDLRPLLRAAKDWHPLYWKTDHHWNDAGGAAAVEAVVRHIRRWFPHEPSLVKEELICEETIERSGTSLAQIIGLSGSYPETRHTPEHPSWQTHEISRSTDPETGNSIWTNASKPDGLRVVCIGDSFTFALLDLDLRRTPPVARQARSRIRAVRGHVGDDAYRFGRPPHDEGAQHKNNEHYQDVCDAMTNHDQVPWPEVRSDESVRWLAGVRTAD